MFEKILRKIINEKLIQPNDKIVLGFSGGPDSVFLLEVLLFVKKSINFDFVLVHINHLLRGDDSDNDENFVKNIGKTLNLETFIKRTDITEYSKVNNLTLEEGGREIRYNFFNEVLEKTGGNKIAIAHNLDDQIENFLFRMIRGCSLEGLEGINHRDNLIRPINEIYKSEILNYLDSNRITYCTDKTNFESDFTRNSIRLDLIPFIENRYNPNFKDKIFNLIAEVRDVNETLKVDSNDYLIEYNKNLSLDSTLILKKSEYLQRKIINDFLKGYDVEISREKIFNILNLMKSGGTKELHLTKDLILKKQYQYIWIENKKKMSKVNELSNNKLKVTIPFDIIYNGFHIYTLEDNKSSGNNEFLTNLSNGDTITIRTRENGDSILPLGMSNYKKIKDIFINEKIPKEERNIIPILEKNNEIIWISGVKKSESFKLNLHNTGIKLIVRRQNEKDIY